MKVPEPLENRRRLGAYALGGSRRSRVEGSGALAAAPAGPRLGATNKKAKLRKPWPGRPGQRRP